MSGAKISVIIPAYNCEDFIERAINSVVCQTYRNYEIIVVNDGSKDKTGKIVGDMAAKNDKIKLINQDNHGVSCARNVGMSVATGEYIVFLDSDDKLEPVALELMGKNIIAYNADICVVNVLPGYTEGYTHIYTPEECIKLCIEDNQLICACHDKIYKLQRLKENGVIFPENAQAHEDSYFVFSCFYHGLNMAWVNNKVYFYNSENIHSLSRSGFSLKRFSIIELAEKKRDLINSKYPQYTSIADNVLIKANMAFIGGFDIPKEYKKEEKKCVRNICKYKKFFIPATKYDEKLFFIVTHHLYGICKFFIKNKRFFRRSEKGA